MNAYRLMAVAVTTCAAGLSLAACTAGITAASLPRAPATTRTPSSPAAAASHTGSASASPAPRVSVDAPIGSFPIPHQAQVVVNATCGKQIIIELISVTPSQVSDFYLSALPREGYTITSHSLVDGPEVGVQGAIAQIEFTGHGYKGTIGAVANLRAASSRGLPPPACPATSPGTSSRSR